jgi:hypothetical protein
MQLSKFLPQSSKAFTLQEKPTQIDKASKQQDGSNRQANLLSFGKPISVSLPKSVRKSRSYGNHSNGEAVFGNMREGMRGSFKPWGRLVVDSLPSHHWKEFAWT